MHTELARASEFPVPSIKLTTNPLFWLNVLAIVCVFTGFALGCVVPPSATVNPQNGMLHFDGLWYFDIATHGYQWDPAHGQLYKHYQNAAFFPFFPLLDRLTLFLVGAKYVSLALCLLGLGFGLASNIMFSKMAAQLLAPRAAFWASAAYIVWPAALFYWIGYPVGLINLLALLALHNYAAGRIWRSAVCCALAGFAAPAGVFIAAGLDLALLLDLWQAGGSWRQMLMRLSGFAVLSVSGLLVFMVYLLFRFHDPLVFIKAQAAWSLKDICPGFLRHLQFFINPLWYLGVFLIMYQQALTVHGLHDLICTATGWDAFRVIMQYGFDFLTFVVGMSMTAWFVLRMPRVWRPIALTSLAVLVGYDWFVICSTWYFNSGMRLCFPAFTIFFGLGWLLSRFRRPVVPALIIAGLALFLVLQSALLMAGYEVV